MANNYVELLNEYNKLKEDFDEHKLIAEEYERELESTNKEYEQKIKDLKETNERLIKEISKLKDDYIVSKEKNMEKIKEIDYLEKQLDKFKGLIESGKLDKMSIDKRLIILENENNDYLNKARELEFWADDLKAKLDAALEENIMLHSENETFKSDMEEMIQRLQEELEEAKNEISSKEKIINGMSMHRDFLIKTAYNAQDDINNKVIETKSYNTLKNTGSGRLKVLTPVNDNIKIPEKFMQSYSKTFFDVHEQKEDKDVSRNDITMRKFDSKEEFDKHKIKSNKNSFILNNDGSLDDKFKSKKESIERYRYDRKSSARISVSQLEKYLKGSMILNENEKADLNDEDDDNDDDENEEEKEFIKQKIDLEIKNILDTKRNFILNTLTQENFSFDINNNLITKTSPGEVKENSSKKTYGDFRSNVQKARLNENLDDIISKIQARKEKVILQKKVMLSKLEKVGIKIF
jgi:cell division protein FtsB